MWAMHSAAEIVAHQFAEAINAHDVSALCALMTESHRFIDSLGTVVTGRETMRAGWKGYFGMVPDYAISVDETYSNGPIVVMVGKAGGSYAPKGLQTAESRWETPAAFRVNVENGKVAEWRVYADNEPIRRLVG
jgi:ketosteroid isomerase-like protein